MIQYPHYRQHRFSSFQVIIAGFAAVDLVGALLLMLPIAAQQRCVTPFHEALFTSTSALCVTGLVVQDTGSYWSAFGQSVILLLIQIGGLGVITVGAAFALLSGRKISLKQRSTMQEATAAPQMGGIVRLTGFILRITALFELAGAALLLPTFCADYGLRGIWYALFHSISAFCNAGFDLLGTEGAKFVSLTRYAGDPLPVSYTHLRLVEVQQLHLPAPALDVPGVHPHEAVGEQRSFLAAGTGAYLHDDAFLVVYVLRQQQNFEIIFQLCHILTFFSPHRRAMMCLYLRH